MLQPHPAPPGPRTQLAEPRQAWPLHTAPTSQCPALVLALRQLRRVSPTALDGPRPGRQSCGGVHSPSLSTMAGALQLASWGADTGSAQGLAQAGFPAQPSPPPCKHRWFPGRPPTDPETCQVTPSSPALVFLSGNLQVFSGPSPLSTGHVCGGVTGGSVLRVPVSVSSYHPWSATSPMGRCPHEFGMSLLCTWRGPACPRLLAVLHTHSGIKGGAPSLLLFCRPHLAPRTPA